ncbi:concanavalin A-like lectin/glucanase domain-containing protein [Halteromyces radiatus]|uniref:concanavalin A-like lectin/glucanase domain-containing protein n=1 Tax=Halteromyces radiatus TaxID=101107 RepID=UPI00221E6753|nr:concanavalin A-like lectin/glucanase domain-containing protein [Halteromyces radiatus]KAI8081430.1 concanavalin A-like lectin/glucanase domain-containing protein [Halteromyces radiatus]
MDYTVRRNLSGLPHDYLRVFSPDNIRLTPYSVQLTVEIDHDILTSAAFGTQRNDILYGTFRASMKPPVAPGTVSSFYYFESNSAEIDVEILGRYTDPRQAFFVVHPQIYNQDGSASNLTHQRKNLQSDPTLDFHEYRFDWLPGLVDYFVDGNLSATINTNVPSVPGRIIVNHWSDGNPNFSGLPEEGQNIVLDVANLTFFFNSSNDIFGPPCESSKTPCDVKDIMSRKLLPGSSATSLTSSSLRSLLSLLIIPIVLVSFIMSS